MKPKFDYADEGERTLAERDLTKELRNMGTPIYNGPPVLYRIRVEQWPNENFKRYFPEWGEKIDTTGRIVPDESVIWRKIANSGSPEWYMTLESAQFVIDKYSAKYRKHTEEIIPYTPK